MSEIEAEAAKSNFLEDLKSKIEGGRSNFLTQAQLLELLKAYPDFRIDSNTTVVIPSIAADAHAGENFSGKPSDSE